MSEEQNNLDDKNTDNPIIPPSATSEYVSESNGDIPNPPINYSDNGEVSNNNNQGNNKKTISLADKIAIGALIVALVVGIFTVRLFYQTEDAVKISADALSDSRKKDSIQDIKDKKIDSINRVKDSFANERDRLSFELSKQDYIERSKKDSINLELTKKTLQAQINSIKESQREFEIENRPVIEIVDIKIDSFGINKSFTLSYRIFNIGKYPAIVRYVKESVAFEENKTVDEIKKDSPYVIIKNVSSGIANESFIPQWLKATVKNQNDLNLFKDGKVFIFLFVEIYYENIANKRKYKHTSYYKIGTGIGVADTGYDIEGLGITDVQIDKY